MNYITARNYWPLCRVFSASTPRGFPSVILNYCSLFFPGNIFHCQCILVYGQYTLTGSVWRLLESLLKISYIKGYNKELFPKMYAEVGQTIWSSFFHLIFVFFNFVGTLCYSRNPGPEQFIQTDCWVNTLLYSEGCWL